MLNNLCIAKKPTKCCKSAWSGISPLVVLICNILLAFGYAVTVRATKQQQAPAYIAVTTAFLPLPAPHMHMCFCPAHRNAQNGVKSLAMQSTRLLEERADPYWLSPLNNNKLCVAVTDTPSRHSGPTGR